MCQKVLDMLPREAAPALLNKLGFPSSVIDVLDQEYPGGYNFAKRIRLALEAWSGLTFDDTVSANPNTTGPVAPEPLQGVVASFQGHFEDYDKRSGSGKGPVAAGGAGVTETAPIPSDSGLSQVDAKLFPTQESQSLHSSAHISSVNSQPNIFFLLKEAVVGLEVSPKRLIHLVNILELTELQEALTKIANNAELPRF